MTRSITDRRSLILATNNQLMKKQSATASGKAKMPKLTAKQVNGFFEMAFKQMSI
ncbi:hypothetical protein [Pseudomonas fragi]|uniref:hypothetical protein n=1 Tax=Pseudomonas fragi TaxID=296 RepID=UPI001595C9E5|nr:hypothetical protein [Pseudomonas fragi]